MCVEENVIDNQFVLTLPAAKNLYDIFASLASDDTSIFEAVVAQNDRLEQIGPNRLRLVE